jgi:hypothetical protein
MNAHRVLVAVDVRRLICSKEDQSLLTSPATGEKILQPRLFQPRVT